MECDNGIQMFVPNSEETTNILAHRLIYMRKNKLKLNPDKTEVFLVRKKLDPGIEANRVLGGALYFHRMTTV